VGALLVAVGFGALRILQLCCPRLCIVDTEREMWMLCHLPFLVSASFFWYALLPTEEGIDLFGR
jgi:hypothetical protein